MVIAQQRTTTSSPSTIIHLAFRRADPHQMTMKSMAARAMATLEAVGPSVSASDDGSHEDY
eukprot:SAG11_NODE_2263_length_3607_cov_3.882839_3_plen_61_part_00